MNAETQPSRSRSTTTLLLLLISLLAIGVLVVLAMVKSREGDPALPTPHGEGAGTESAQAATLQAQGSTDRPPGGTERRERDSDQPAATLTCLRRADGRPLAGVRMYLGAEPVAGPSDAEGTLQVQGAPAGSLTLWAKGWVPVAVRGASLPSEVEFEAALASLELRFLNATSEHRLLRGLLQAHAPGPASEGPWTPTLEEQGRDVYVAERVAPGTYNLYVWVTFPSGEPLPFSRDGLEVGADGRTQVSIDLAAPRDPNEAESDS